MQVGDLVRCTHGSGNGTVGLIVALIPHGVTTLARFNNGDLYSIERLEVINAV